MTAEPSEVDAPQTFRLRPAPPLRGLAVTAALVLIGAVVLVVAVEYAWPAAFSWTGVALMVLGLLVGVTAAVSTRRWRTDVIVRREGITIAGSWGRSTLPWRAISKVGSFNGNLVLVPTAEADDDLVILNPRGEREPQLDPLVAAIRRRLDDDRRR